MDSANRSPLFLQQLLGGRDHASTHPIAGQMANFAYLVGCRESGECLIVDPSWDPVGLVRIAEQHEMRLTGCIATHTHPDHIGGSWMGVQIPGVRELAVEIEGPFHVHTEEAGALREAAGLEAERLIKHGDGDSIEIGSVRIELLHTPGHTPGGLCLLVEGHVITGDVLFVGACGRVDLPGADPRAMFESLRRLGRLPGETIVLPGHDYGMAPRSAIADELRTNPTMRAGSAEEWARSMGGTGF